MRVLLPGAVGAALALVALGGPAGARPAPRPAPRPAALTPLIQAATDCFAEQIVATRAARRRAGTGDWYGAAGIVAPLCRPEVDAMVRRHDALLGFGSGERFFTGAYTHELARTLAGRVRLAPVDTADALPVALPAAASDTVTNAVIDGATGPAPESATPAEPRS